MACCYAYLNNFQLPTQFSYKPVAPRKAYSQTVTGGGVVTQMSTNVPILWDKPIKWSIKGAYPYEWKFFYDLYVGSNDAIEFVGYWGDSFQVIMSSLDDAEVKGRLFNMSGEFIICCLSTSYNFACNCQGIPAEVTQPADQIPTE